MGRRIVLHSPLDPIALATRLRDVLGKRKSKPKRGPAGKGVSGQGDDQQMMLFVRSASGAMSATRFNAVMDPDDSGGTRIVGRFSIGHGFDIGMIVWCLFLLIFMTIGYFITTSGRAPDVGIPFMLIPAVMIVVPIALQFFGARSRPADRAAILRFLADIVQAVPE